MAVSHAMEGKSGGSKPLAGNHYAVHMVGGTPTVQAKLGGVDMLCVVDSGSMVFFEEAPANLWAHEKTEANAYPACC